MGVPTARYAHAQPQDISYYLFRTLAIYFESFVLPKSKEIYQFDRELLN